MRVAEITHPELQHRLRMGDLSLRIGPFAVRVQSEIDIVASGLGLLYADYPVEEGDFADFHVSVSSIGGVRRFFRPQVNFYRDHLTPYKPLPKAQALPMFEWGLNWSITATSHQYLILHSAVVEKNGAVMMLPAPPGSGKSTLCAGLVSRGWRLFSDELALIPRSFNRESSIQVFPCTRPISLKNRSIEVISEFAPDATIGPLTHDTAKGTVAHVRAPYASVAAINEPALARWVIFPRYIAGSPTLLTGRSRASTFLFMAQQAFNYNVHGQVGFELLRRTIDQCGCYDFQYSNLEEAVALFDRMADEHGRGPQNR